MNRNVTNPCEGNKKWLRLLGMCLLIGSLWLQGCGSEAEKSDADKKVTAETGTQQEQDDAQDVPEEEPELVPFSEASQYQYISASEAAFSDGGKKLDFSYDFEAVPQSDDEYLYVFGQEIYQTDDDFSGEPMVKEKKKTHFTVSVAGEQRQLFLRYCPAILLNGKYVPLQAAQYVSNPEALAKKQKDIPEHVSKKGILIDPATLGSPLLSEINTTHGVYNMPLSFFVGSEDDQETPQETFEYDGKTYYFRANWLAAYDGLYTTLEGAGIYPTAIILNDWNEAHPELVHPDARGEGPCANYYQFNTSNEEGVKLMQATALFLAERYSNGEHGRVYNWVIANEVNQQTIWNYMNTTDLEYYTQAFEESFRTFYNAIKSNYSGANVYFSIDNCWNNNEGKNEKYFNAKELLEVFNQRARLHGNYDWSLAIHPYPVPLTKVNYWSSQNDMTENAPALTVMNLSTLTDVLEKEEFRNPNGEVRSVAITELGYTSLSGEKLQAAAFAYCYKIIDANPYIDLLLLSRQTDAPEEIKGGLALGLYEVDHSPKYLKEVFTNIDGEGKDAYDELIVNVLKAESIEEAMSWAVKPADR